MADFEITPLYDACDEHVEFMVRGHVDREALLAQVNDEWKHLGVYALEDVEHVYRKAVPDPSGDKRCIYHPSAAGVRGAFTATTVDAWGPVRRAQRARLAATAPSPREAPETNPDPEVK